MQRYEIVYEQREAGFPRMFLHYPVASRRRKPVKKRRHSSMKPSICTWKCFSRSSV